MTQTDSYYIQTHSRIQLLVFTVEALRIEKDVYFKKRIHKDVRSPLKHKKKLYEMEATAALKNKRKKKEKRERERQQKQNKTKLVFIKISSARTKYKPEQNLQNIYGSIP